MLSFLQAFFQYFRLAVRAVQNRDVGKFQRFRRVRAGYIGLGVQHVDAAHHAVDLLGNVNALGKARFPQ